LLFVLKDAEGGGCIPVTSVTAVPSGLAKDRHAVDLAVIDKDVGVGVQGHGGPRVAGALCRFGRRDALPMPERSRFVAENRRLWEAGVPAYGRSAPRRRRAG
jgi:hypothetical protein